MILVSLRALALSFSFLASMASAKDPRQTNVFFGFEYVLSPLSVKWCCGGPSDQDLSQIDALLKAFPEDADRADLQKGVQETLEGSKRSTAISEIFDRVLSDKEVEELCAVALPLNIDWLTPEQLSTGNDEGIPFQQRAAWKAFYRLVG